MTSTAATAKFIACVFIRGAACCRSCGASAFRSGPSAATAASAFLPDGWPSRRQNRAAERHDSRPKKARIEALETASAVPLRCVEDGPLTPYNSSWQGRRDLGLFEPLETGIPRGRRPSDRRVAEAEQGSAKSLIPGWPGAEPT